jgi:hypothetical protein
MENAKNVEIVEISVSLHCKATTMLVPITLVQEVVFTSYKIH